jgi:hypothetical protein
MRWEHTASERPASVRRTVAAEQRDARERRHRDQDRAYSPRTLGRGAEFACPGVGHHRGDQAGVALSLIAVQEYVHAPHPEP